MDTEAGASRPQAYAKNKCPNARQLLGPFKLLWETLGRLDPECLPGVAVEAIGFEDRLPVTTTAVYFLMRKGRILYIGRATNLRNRWRVENELIDTSKVCWERCHHKLADALELGDVSLHWWVLPRKYLAIAESVFLQIHRPPWNNHRG
jgi:hypothetical protein